MGFQVLGVQGIVQWLFDEGAVVGSGCERTVMELLRTAPAFSATAVELLVEAGVLEMSDSEFGDSAVALRMRSVTWECSAPSIRPSSVLLSQGPSAETPGNKLDIMLNLASNGWASNDGIVGDLVPLGPRVFSLRMLRRSLSYWECLQQVDDIFKRGWRALMHHMPDGYYKCALFLEHPHQVEALHAHPDLRELTNADFVSFLKGMPLRAPVLQPIADGEAHDDAEMAPPPIADGHIEPPPMAQVVVSFPVAPETVHCGAVVVHFDNFTHRSGVQRGYTACGNPLHHACFKYRQVDGFTTWRECAGWLAAWNSMGQVNCETKEEHKHMEPYPTDVARAVASIAG